MESVIESSISKGPDAVLATVTRARPAAEAVSAYAFQLARCCNWRAGSGRLASRPHRTLDQHAGLGRLPSSRSFGYFGVPAVMDNDANLMGLGEQRRIYPNAHQVLFIKVGTGIGASVVIDGELLRGSDSAEGDIGHAKITGVEETCSSCGARGCLPQLPAGVQWFATCDVSATRLLPRVMLFSSYARAT